MTKSKMIMTLDYHTAGEPLRIIRDGLPSISGSSMLEKRRYMEANHDDIRRLLMLEPRGHAPRGRLEGLCASGRTSNQEARPRTQGGVARAQRRARTIDRNRV